jgi:hypothetical protein
LLFRIEDEMVPILIVQLIYVLIGMSSLLSERRARSVGALS